jgi:ribonuclease HII
MARAIDALGVDPQEVAVDGLHVPRTRWPSRAIVKGDRLVPAISAASILAKTARDEEMVSLDALFPGYGFARHKGYPTAEHLAALRALGPCEIHRRTFGPVREAIAQHRLPW